MKIGNKVIIAKGRLRGEMATIIGTTDLNMEHRLIVRRHNPRARDKIMGFNQADLKGK